MSSLRKPVGSKPPRVYWRRRATVVGVLLLVVIFIAIAFRQGTGSDASPVPATSSPTSAAGSGAKSAPGSAEGSAATAKATASAAPAPVVTAPTASSSPVASSTPTAAATAAAQGTCTSSDITLKPIADKTTYSSLQQPQISMSITNSSSSPCSIDLGSSQQVLTITSGSDTYWSSKDCQVNGTHQIVKLTAGQTLTTPSIAWDRTRSSTSTCSATRPSVPAGGANYHLSVSVGSITSSTTALIVLK